MSLTLNQLSEKFKLNPDVVPVKGISRCLLCDFTRNEYHLIPNSLYQILQKSNITNTIQTVIDAFAEGDTKVEEIIKEYFVFLLEKELIFFTNNPECYTEIELNWDYPAVVSNAIIDVGAHSSLDFAEILPQLLTLGCIDVQVRYFREINIEELISSFLSVTVGSRLKTIEIIAPYKNENALVEAEKLIDAYERIKFIQFYNAPDSKVVKEAGYNGMGFLTIVEGNTANELHCGVVLPHYFVKNVLSFSESQHHNTCLNRKIAIDVEGNIKNCPSMSQSFGNIRDTTLQEALDHPDFKKYWNVTKDQISVCKDCEFRHICTDCRAYIENPEDRYSKPLKCGYNPYTCEWEEWSTNPLKQQAIDHYGMREVLPEFKT